MSDAEYKAIAEAIDSMTPQERERCFRALNVLGFRLQRIDATLATTFYRLCCSVGPRVSPFLRLED